jgi:hypothetical protein
MMMNEQTNIINLLNSFLSFMKFESISSKSDCLQVILI